MRARDRADAAVALVVLLLGQQEVWAPAAGFDVRVRPLWLMSLVLAVAATALVLRRRRPLLTVLVVTGTLSALSLLAGSPDGLGVLLPLILCAYSAARHAALRRAWAAAAAVAAATVVHEAYDPGFQLDGRAVSVWLVLAAAAAAGLVLRHRVHDVDVARRDAAEAERARLAAELHDLVGHGMSLGVVQVAAAQATLEHGRVPEAARRLEQLETTMRTTLEEMRRLVAVNGTGTGAPLAPQPTLRDLEALVAEVRAAGTPVSLEVDVPTAVPPGVALAAYRVVQESLTNVLRHAHAPAAVRVREEEEGQLRVEVTDEGEGAQQLSGGHGIDGMRRRVELYGGRLDVSTVPGQGVTVRAVIPLAGRA